MCCVGEGDVVGGICGEFEFWAAVEHIGRGGLIDRVSEDAWFS